MTDKHAPPGNRAGHEVEEGAGKVVKGGLVLWTCTCQRWWGEGALAKIPRHGVNQLRLDIILVNIQWTRANVNQH